VEKGIVDSGAGELGFVADTDTLFYTVVSVPVFCYGGPKCFNNTSARISA